MAIYDGRITQGIIDRSWRHHLEHGQVIDEWQAGGYRAVMIRVTEQISVIYYHLRVLFFAAKRPVPVFSANLESSMFQDARFLGVHTTEAHYNHGPVATGLEPEEFKRWACRAAGEYLGPSEPDEKKVSTASPTDTPVAS